MPLEAFSNALIGLYEIAEHTTPDDFPAEALRQIQKLIEFDGAMFGNGAIAADASQGLVIEQAYIYNRDKNLLQEYSEVLGADPIARAFLDGIEQPLACDCAEVYALEGLEQLAALAQRHDLRNLLLKGQKPTAETSALGLALYRAAGPQFDDADVMLMHVLWPHVLHATRVNLQRALRLTDPHGQTRALALVNSRGMIDVMNDAMTELLRLEWPGFNGRGLPSDALGILVAQGVFRGKRIEISVTAKYGYLACVARRTPLVDMLSPSERAVADHFSKGLQHKEIAVRLNVSPNTVRNQIAQIYQKLGVHSKAELVRTLSSRVAR